MVRLDPDLSHSHGCRSKPQPGLNLDLSCDRSRSGSNDHSHRSKLQPGLDLDLSHGHRSKLQPGLDLDLHTYLNQTHIDVPHPLWLK